MTFNNEKLQETPSQTAGPYVHIGLIPPFCGNEQQFDTQIGESPILDGVRGEKITIRGTIMDAQGALLKDSVIESWQADANGLYAGQEGADEKCPGFARTPTHAETGLFELNTIKPGTTTLRDGRTQAPHIALWIIGRGINIGLQTRIYFSDEDNAPDPVLSRIEHKDRVQTLIAQKQDDGTYRFDILLRGDGETVFFDM